MRTGGALVGPPGSWPPGWVTPLPPLPVDVGCGVGVASSVGSGDGDPSSPPGVGVAVAVGVGVAVGVAVGVGVGVGVAVGGAVGVAVAVGVGSSVSVGVGLGVAVRVGRGVQEAVGLWDAVGVCVGGQTRLYPSHASAVEVESSPSDGRGAGVRQCLAPPACAVACDPSPPARYEAAFDAVAPRPMARRHAKPTMANATAALPCSRTRRANPRRLVRRV